MPTADPTIEVKTKIRVRENIKPPSLYGVIYFNDEQTPVMFVIETLVTVFGFTSNDAAALTEIIGVIGSGTVASGLTKELAAHLQGQVLDLAAASGFPLKVEIKEEE